MSIAPDTTRINKPRLRSGPTRIVGIDRDKEKFVVTLLVGKNDTIDVKVTADVLINPKKFASSVLTQQNFFSRGIAECSASRWGMIVAEAMNCGSIMEAVQ